MGDLVNGHKQTLTFGTNFGGVPDSNTRYTPPTQS